jgi:hypothetical protein
MPASLPGSTVAQNQGNPTLGSMVLFDAASGPKNSPFDAQKVDYATAPPAGLPAGWTAARILLKVNDPLNLSTGGLSTGVGYGSPPIIGEAAVGIRFKGPGFTDDYKPGISTLASPVVDSTNSRFMYIGGGKSAIVNGTGPNGNGYPPGWFTSQPVPYVAGFGIAAAGNGGSRDGGAGPAFTGFPLKSVTAVGAVANGAAVETNWTNRSGVGIVAGQSVFGSGTAQLAALS